MESRTCIQSTDEGLGFNRFLLLDITVTHLALIQHIDVNMDKSGIRPGDLQSSVLGDYEGLFKMCYKFKLVIAEP